MSRSAWQPLNKANVEKIEIGAFVVIARPDGKSWSGILQTKEHDGLGLRNANIVTGLHYVMNPTASFVILTSPKWELGFGQPRLGF